MDVRVRADWAIYSLEEGRMSTLGKGMRSFELRASSQQRSGSSGAADDRGTNGWRGVHAGGPQRRGKDSGAFLRGAWSRRGAASGRGNSAARPNDGESGAPAFQWTEEEEGDPRGGFAIFGNSRG